MSPEMRSLEVVTLALIAGAAVYGQLRLLKQDCQASWPPRRQYVPLVVSGLVLVGFLFQGLLSLADARKPEFGLADVFALLLKAVVFAIALNIKTLLGPLFIGYSIGATVYCYCEYNEWVAWPFLDHLFDWIFDASPKGFKYIYLTLTFLYALVSSVWEGWDP